MDKNTKRGIGHEAKGKLKEVTGKITGDKSQELAGRAEKNLGKAQRKVGEATDKLVDEIREAVRIGERMGEEMTLKPEPMERALQAAAQVARESGVTPWVLGDALEGEARDVGQVLAGIAQQVARHGGPVPAPCVLLSGGETTVTVRGQGGRGGRASEFLLGCAIALQGQPGVWGLSADTDGIDGIEDNAGALVTPETLARAAAQGLKVGQHLERNDAYGFFEPLGDLVITGPTHTNVNDFRALLVLPAGQHA